MPKVECRFLGARHLKSGELIGIVTFDSTVDEHKLIDLRRRGTVYLTDEACTVEAERETILKDILDALETIKERIEAITGKDTLHTADEPGGSEL